MMTRLAVLVCGAVGCALVGRAALSYRTTDQLSFGLALLIGVGLLAGLVETFLRTAKAERIATELRRKAPQSIDAVDQCGPDLQQLLRRRLVGGELLFSAGAFANYLLGLLVMIGMLGTFLGLFESLRGAREALTSSGDVDALRSALAYPLQGLSRAFGISAAGVSASASLGLAVVFARRAESRLVKLLSASVLGPLASWTTAGRQLAALETLARHGPALALSASALQEATQQLDGLRRDLLASHKEGYLHAAEAIRETSAAVQSDIQGAIERAARATEQAVEPLFERLAARASEVAGEHWKHWSERIDDESQQRQAEELNHLKQTRTIVAEATAGLLNEVGPGVDRIQRRIEGALGQLGSSVQHLTELQQQNYVQMQGQLRTLADESAERLCALAESATLQSTQAASEQLALADAFQAKLQHLVASSTERELDRNQQVAAQGQQTRELISAGVNDWLERTSLLGEQLEQRHAHALQVVSQKLGELMGHAQKATQQLIEQEREQAIAIRGSLEQSIHVLQQAKTASAASEEVRLRSLREAVEQMRGDAQRSTNDTAQRTDQLSGAVERFGAALERLERGQADRLAGAVDRLLGQMSQHVERLQAEHLAWSEEATGHINRVDALVSEHLERLGQRLTEPLSDVVRTSQAAPEAAALLVESARQSLQERAGVEAQRDKQFAELLLRFSEATDAIRRASDQQRLSAEQYAQHAEIRAMEAEVRAQDRLDALATRLQSIADQQADRLAEFQMKIDESRNQGAQQLAERLAEHSHGLGDSLGSTASLVREAADLVHAGGAEMASVAEMFAAAVDQYRTASDRLLSSLGPIQEAMERAGQRGTVDLIGTYLDQTREVFDSSLRFQRELFSELRALRGVKSRASSGS